MICNNCGVENEDSAAFCKNCGSMLSEETAQTNTENTTPANGPVYVEPAQNDKNYTGFSIASMVLGIVSVVFCCSTIVSIVCGVLAIIFARNEKQKGYENGLAKTGLICGIVGAALGAIYLIYCIILFAIGSTATFYPSSFRYKF